MLKLFPIKTRPFIPPKDDLFSLIKESFSNVNLKEKSIIVVTSKIVSIWQGRCLKIESIKNKDDLIKKEADFYIERNQVPKGYVMLTIKNNVLIPTAGIDENNTNGYYILWPENPCLAAKKIHNFIKKTYRLKDFGIIISDSHTIPMRWGTMGISIGYWGFYPLKDYRGTEDIFGRKMKISQSNIVDSLAAAAILIMGEGSEQTPFAVIEGINFIKFEEFDPTNSNPLEIEADNDIYHPLLKTIKWHSTKTKQF
ncbi:MAG: gamma-glutamyl ligase [Parcubacteria group bacterium]|nr:gamma-glutamyl ligase [Parcubacteria group bacterium]|tara:strand:- start:3661 stop:4422 length:762 start_codon:yes stop_codon:yes gene_type:complete